MDKIKSIKGVKIHLYLIEQKLEGNNLSKFGDVKHFRVSDFTFDRESKSMVWIQQKTNRRNSFPINDISGFIFRKFSCGKKLEQKLFPELLIQKFNKHLKLLLQ